MLDPLSAIGLASNIISFIDFASKLLSTSQKLYGSLRGATEGHVNLQATTEDLKRLCADLRAPTFSQPAQAADTTTSSYKSQEAAIQKLSLECDELAESLLAVLEGLLVRAGNRRWQSFRAAIRIKWSESRIKEAEARLRDFRDQISLRLTSLINDKHSDVFLTLQRISRQQEELRIESASDVQQLRDNILKELAGIKKANLTDLVEYLQHLTRTAEEKRREQAVLWGLYFKTMRARHSNITRAHAKTFEWIFDEEQDRQEFHHHFPQWLRRDSGIFWITGKAGSGKSTLMKYLLGQRKLTRMLSKWAGNDDLIVSSFFFWAAGTKLQKSQEGLMRSLLYELLRRRPSWIPIVAQDRWRKASDFAQLTSSEPLHRDELFHCFERLADARLAHQRFCFFIDGLDEYDGDYADLVEVLKVIDQAPNIKICVSSRPRNMFESSFGGKKERNLVLQRFTKNDIRLYVDEKLQDQQHYKMLCDTDENATRLVDAVAERAQGVFLWVFLVIKSLSRGLTNADTISDLERRLSEMPEDLEDYFLLMLDRIEKFYHEESAKMLLACIAAAEPLPLGVLSLLDGRCESFLNDDSEVSHIPPQDSLDTMRTRINARCTDLVEVVSESPVTSDHRRPTHAIALYKVDFLHRTVRDFLRTPELHHILLGRLGQKFDEYHAIPRAFYLFIRQQHHHHSDRCQPCSELVQNLMYYAREREQIEDKADISLMIGLHNYCMQFPFYNLESTASFLQCVASWGLLHFMTSVMQGSALPRRLENDVLHDALHSALVRPRGAISEPASPTLVNPKMIALFLENGANANYRKSGAHSIWESFLLAAYKAAQTPLFDVRQNLYEVCVCLISSGASYNVQIATGRTNEKVVGGGTPVRYRIFVRLNEVFDTIFDGEQRQNLDNLIQRQKSRQSWWSVTGAFAKLLGRSEDRG